MTIKEFESLEPGTKLLVGDKFLDDYDANAAPWLGKVITFSSISGKWVYYEEAEDAPFRYDEIVGLYNAPCIDDVNIPYELGDTSLIFGEV